MTDTTETPDDMSDEQLAEALAQTDPDLPAGWRGILAPLDTRSGDDRIIGNPATLRLRTPPLPFLHQQATAMGHDNSVVVSRIDRAWIEDGKLMGEGPYDLASEAGREAARSLAAGYSNGVSVDLDDAVFEVRFIDQAGAQLDTPGQDDEAAWEALFTRLMDGEVREIAYASDWRLMGATQVAHPAFDEARIEPVYDYVPAEPAAAVTASLVASPVVFSAADFRNPGLGEYNSPYLTVTDDRRVFGHVAPWSTCHTGFDVCVTAPHSITDYAYFHLGEVTTDEGPLAVGKITLGGGHADPKLGLRAATEHYDDAAAAVAAVRVGEDEFGIWVAGRLLPDVTDEQITRLRLSPLSGDWRRVGGNLELVAALAVNTPGFPIPRTVAASADGRQVSLVAAGMLPPAPRLGAAPTPDVEDRLVARVLAELDAQQRRKGRVAAAAGRVRRARIATLAARIRAGEL